MEASDTVMTGVMIIEKVGHTPIFLHEVVKLLEEQAEISFKSGYKQRQLEENPLVQQGRKEVVEWIEDHPLVCVEGSAVSGFTYRQIDLGEWQAKLKKWGIEC